MSNFYYELDVESVLQCPVCYDLPQNDIFLCKVGHHMCDRCRKKLSSCPTCQAALTGSRNFLAEALISKFSVFKDETPTNNNLENSINGDTEGHIQENNQELKSLPVSPGLYKCLLESCRNRTGMGASNLFPHIESVHSHLFDKFKNKYATFTHNFSNFCFMKSRKKYNRAFHISNMGLFFLNLQVLEGNYINCWISMPARVSRAKQFKYEIEFSKEEDNTKLLFVSQMAANPQEYHWLLERGLVFVMSPSSHNLKNGDFFSLLVKIIYRSPSNAS